MNVIFDCLKWKHYIFKIMKLVIENIIALKQRASQCLYSWSIFILRVFLFLEYFCTYTHRAAHTVYLIRQKFVGNNCRNFGLVSKILSNERFCPSKFCPIFQYKSEAKSDKIIEISAWCRKFYPTKDFVRRNFVQ